MSNAPPAIPYEAIEGLLADLRAEGLHLGAREEIAVARLLAELVARGALSGPRDLRPYLQPILARTEDQITSFARVFDRWFPAPDAPVLPAPITTRATPDTKPALLRRPWRTAGLALLAILGVALAIIRPWQGEPTPAPQILAPSAPPEQPQTPPPPPDAVVSAQASAWVNAVLHAANRDEGFMAPSLRELAADGATIMPRPSAERIAANTGFPVDEPQGLLAEPWRLARIAYAWGILAAPNVLPPSPEELLQAAELAIMSNSLLPPDAPAALKAGEAAVVYQIAALPAVEAVVAATSAEELAAATLGDSAISIGDWQNVRQRGLALWNQRHPDRAVQIDDPNRADDRPAWLPFVLASEQRWIPLAAAALPLLFLWIWLTSSLERRKAYLRRRAPIFPPSVHDLVARHARQSTPEDHVIHRAAQTLQQWAFRDTDRLDVAKTVEHSISQGRFTPRYAHARAQPDYLVLIETTGVGDQEAARLRTLVRRLEERHLAVTVHYFERDPAMSHPEPHGALPGSAPFAIPPVELEALAQRYPHHRLLVLSAGAGLIDPVTGEPTESARTLLAWPARALLTPRPIAEWQAREFAIAQTLGLPIGRATAEGLLTLGGLLGLEGIQSVGQISYEGDSSARPLPPTLRARLDRWTTEMPVSDVSWRELQTQLRRYLDTDGYTWLCACAVYPELRWDMTLFLGAQVKGLGGEPLYGERRLAAITQLPWFRMGRMPDWLRTRLVEELGPVASAVQQALMELLASARVGSTTAADEETIRLRIATVTPGSQEVFEDTIFLEFLAKAQATDLEVEAIDPLRALTPQSLDARPRDPMAPAVAILGTAALALAVLTAPVGGKIGLFDWVNRFDTGVSLSHMFWSIVPIILAGAVLLLLDRNAPRIATNRRPPEWALWSGALGWSGLSWAMMGLWIGWVSGSGLELTSNIATPIAGTEGWAVLILMLGIYVAAFPFCWLWLWRNRSFSWAYCTLVAAVVGAAYFTLLVTPPRLPLWVLLALAILLSAAGTFGATRLTRPTNAQERAAERRRDPPRPRPRLAIGAATAMLALASLGYVYTVAESQTRPAGITPEDVIAETDADSGQRLLATTQGFWRGRANRWVELSDPAPVLSEPIVRVAMHQNCLIAADQAGTIAVGRLEERTLTWLGPAMPGAGPVLPAPVLAVNGQGQMAAARNFDGAALIEAWPCDQSTTSERGTFLPAWANHTTAMRGTESGWLIGDTQGQIRHVFNLFAAGGPTTSELTNIVLGEPVTAIELMPNPQVAGDASNRIFVARTESGATATFAVAAGGSLIAGNLSVAPESAIATPAPAEAPTEFATEAPPTDGTVGTTQPLPSEQQLNLPPTPTPQDTRQSTRTNPLEALNPETNAWRRAQGANTFEGYQAYLADWPNGANADQARDAIRLLEGFPLPEPPTSPPACFTSEFVIYFEWDRATLNSAAMDTLDFAVSRARGCNIAAVSVVGHTDTSQSAEYSQALSERQASAVRDALVARGVPSSLITTEARGESDLARATRDGVREPLNRRVAVTITFAP
jgi:outer membrane protein OmpA-like peptidoglycan-associated protein